MLRKFLKLCQQCGGLLDSAAERCRFCGHEYGALADVRKCPHCECYISSTNIICPSCKKQVSDRKCVNCGSPISDAWKICPACNTIQEEIKPVVPKRKRNAERLRKAALYSILAAVCYFAFAYREAIMNLSSGKMVNNYYAVSSLPDMKKVEELEGEIAFLNNELENKERDIIKSKKISEVLRETIENSKKENNKLKEINESVVSLPTKFCSGENEVDINNEYIYARLDNIKLRKKISEYEDEIIKINNKYVTANNQLEIEKKINKSLMNDNKRIIDDLYAQKRFSDLIKELKKTSAELKKEKETVELYRKGMADAGRK